MKKFLSLILALLLTFSLLALASCGEHVHKYGAYIVDGDEHYKQCIIDDCDYISFKDTHLFSQGVCVICACEEVLDQTANPESLGALSAKIKDGAVITLTPGTYSSSLRLTSKKNVTIKGQNGVVFTDNIKLDATCENIVIENITFDKGVPTSSSVEAGGIRILNDVDGLTIRNCEFNNYAHIRVVLTSAFTHGIKDLVIENCRFFDQAYGEGASSLYMGCTIENVTIKDCVFRNIQHNAVQLSGVVKGNVNFINSTYEDIGHRFFNINNAPNVNWNITGNKFYMATVEVYGQYFKGSKDSGTAFNIGVNYWEVIPELDPYYFCLYDSESKTYVTDGITYDEEAQLTIQ